MSSDIDKFGSPAGGRRLSSHSVDCVIRDAGRGDRMASELQRTIEPGNILFSPENPRIRIKVDEALTYAGGITKMLSGIAEAEIHYFVVPDSANRINRSFHVQFEHFLPDNTETYNYELPDTIRLGDHEYMHNPGS